MSDYKVTDTELTSVANAIRTKGGTSAQLEWPTGFVSAIGNISGGGDDPFALTDYIESSGTQYIDTGYTITSNSHIELVANANPIRSYSSLLGSRNGASVSNFYIGRSYNDASYEDHHGSTYSNLASLGNFTSQKFCLTKYMTGSKIERQDTVCAGVAYTDSEFTSQYNLVIFGLNSAGDVSALTSMKLYRFRIYEGTTLVHEFIPWTDDNDVVCLKDTVTGNLKYNAGTGDFTYGTDA